MAPRCKSSDVGNLDMPKRNSRVLSLNERVKVLNLKRRGKKLHVEVAKVYGRNESFICEIVKEKEIGVNFAVTHQTVKFTTTVHDKCLVKMEKPLSSYSKIF